MANINNGDNEFQEQIEKIEVFQKNASNPGHYVGTGKVPPQISGLRKYPVALIIVGVIGFAFTGISLINVYKSSDKAQDIVLPLIYNFVPFVISFLLCRIGISELIKRTK
jgi:hypothetical protein